MPTKRHKTGDGASIVKALLDVAKEADKICGLRGDITERERSGLKRAMKQLCKVSSPYAIVKLK